MNKVKVADVSLGIFLFNLFLCNLIGTLAFASAIHNDVDMFGSYKPIKIDTQLDIACLRNPRVFITEEESELSKDAKIKVIHVGPYISFLQKNASQVFEEEDCQTKVENFYSKDDDKLHAETQTRCYGKITYENSRSLDFNPKTKVLKYTEVKNNKSSSCSWKKL